MRRIGFKQKTSWQTNYRTAFRCSFKHNNITNAIRTKEYVDLDLLENMMYHNEIPQDVIVQMGDCKSEKEVITLRVSKRK